MKNLIIVSLQIGQKELRNSLKNVKQNSWLHVVKSISFPYFSSRHIGQLHLLWYSVCRGSTPRSWCLISWISLLSELSTWTLFLISSIFLFWISISFLTFSFLFSSPVPLPSMIEVGIQTILSWGRKRGW